MANVFLDNSDNLTKVASLLISKDLKVASLVGQTFSPEFNGRRGASVNVRIPATLTAQTRNLGVVTSYTTSDLTESSQAVALTTDHYSRTAIADSDLTLSVQDYARDVIAVQAAAIARAIEVAVITEIDTVTENATMDTAYDAGSATDILNLLVDMRKALRDLGAPEESLRAVMGTASYAALLKAVAGASYDQGIGDLGTASVVRVGGLSIVESNRLTANEVVAFHKDAFHLALKAPAPTQDGKSSSQMAEQGVPVRVVQAFDHSTGQHISLMNTFGGVDTLTANVDGNNVTFAVRVAG